jgi:hypothetical protein
MAPNGAARAISEGDSAKCLSTGTFSHGFGGFHPSPVEPRGLGVGRRSFVNLLGLLPDPYNRAGKIRRDFVFERTRSIPAWDLAA